MPNIHHRRRLVLDGTQMPAPVGDWSMARQTSTDGVLIDTSGNGHHGYYGGVKRAFIGDTVYGDRGLILGGVAANYASTPDAAALDITGDIDLIVKMRCSDWTPANNELPLSKRTATGDQRSYSLTVTATTGLLQIEWSSLGTAALLTMASTVAPTVTNGAVLWCRATLDVDDGAGNRVATFYTSADGITWTQLGDVVTAVGATAIFAGTSIVEFGSLNVGTSVGNAGTVIYRAIIKDGIGGTTVLDVDFSTQAQGTRSFVCSTGQVVTVNQSADTAAMPTRLWWTGTTYLWLPGSSGNYASVADFAGNRPTGDQWFYADIACADASTGTAQEIHGRWTGERSSRFTIDSSGKPVFAWSPDGAAGTVVEVTCSDTIESVAANGTRVQLYVTLDVDDGASHYLVKFYWRVVGGAWAQLGTTTTGGATTSVFAGTANWAAGSLSAGTTRMFGGSIYAASMGTGLIYGADTTLSVDFTATASYNATQTTLTAVSGQSVTVNRSATGLKSTVVDRNKLVGDGVDDYVGMDDHARLDVDGSGNLTLAAIARIHGTPAAEQVLIGKKSGVAAANAGYQMTLGTSRELIGRVTDGTDEAESTTAALTASGKTVCAMTLKRATNADTAYTNGVPVAAANATAVGDLSNASEFRIFTGAAGTNFCAGELESFKLFNRPLSAAQILRLNTEL